MNVALGRRVMGAKILQTARFIWFLVCGELFKACQIHGSAALSEGEDTIPRYVYLY